MPRAMGMKHRSNEQTGAFSQMGHLMVLCEDPVVPYRRFVVLPHLDHANPRRDRSALTEGLSQCGSAMFDAQKCAFEDDLVWTRDCVARYADMPSSGDRWGQ
jgi:fructose/tagatose bisphosphate aldolase